jgi:hypothetical protein
MIVGGQGHHIMHQPLHNWLLKLCSSSPQDVLHEVVAACHQLPVNLSLHGEHEAKVPNTAEIEFGNTLPVFAFSHSSAKAKEHLLKLN